MESAKSNTKPAIGFLTVIDHPQHGLFGGYLVLNLAGRPLEFHCTAPIKPNRAQQILYGPTLEPFLYGEQIGSTLLGHAKTSPLVLCTDREPVLSLRDLVDLPIALVLPPSDSQESGGTGSEAHPTGMVSPPGESLGSEGTGSEAHPTVGMLPPRASQESEATGFEAPPTGIVLRVDAPHARGPRLITFELGRNRLALPQHKGDDRQRLCERLGETAAALDLWEPFTRIREAIEEAQQAAR